MGITRILLIGVLISLCNNGLLGLQYSIEVDGNFPFELSKSENLVLQLDEETVHPWVTGSYFQYLSSGNALAYLNKVGSSIKLFDLKTGKTIRTVPLAKDGPDNVGNEPSAFYWLNKDSIFVFSDLNNGRLSLINDKGVKLKSYELQSESNEYLVEVSEVAGGMVYSKGQLFLGLRIFDFTKTPINSSIISLDVTSGVVSHLEHPLPIDSKFLKRIPFDQRYSSSYIDFNRDNNKLIMSLPMSDYILVKDMHDEWAKHSARSIYFDNLIFLREPVSNYGGSTEKYRDELRFMPRYTGILYDKFRNVYYRIGRLKFNRDLFLKRKSGANVKIYQEFSIQIFDADFKKVGESKFFTKGLLYEQGLFIDRHGLWLLQPQRSNEDEMEFRLMKLIKTN